MKKFKLLFLIIILLGFFFYLGFYFGEQDKKEEIVVEEPTTKLEDLQDIIKLWEKIDEKFVDTRGDQSEEITKQDHIWGAMQGLTASYGDPYTNFLLPEDNQYLNEDIKGEFFGVGMEIVNRDGFLTVVSPLPDTPSFRAGIKPKDIIVEIDGKDSLKMSSVEAVRLIRGEKDTVVKLKLARKGLIEPVEVEIIRALIKIPVTKTFEKGEIFVIKIYSFSENSPQKFLEAVQEFVKSRKQKLIIDVRGNPGGHLFAVTYILGMFLEEGEIILTEDYGDKQSPEKENKILKSGDYHEGNTLINIFNDNLQLGILVDEGSASASEILAGVLLDYQKAILFGKNTFGKGTVQELLPLEDETALKVTIAKWILPQGSWISEKGIQPDVEIEISDEEIEKNLEDGTFQAGIDSQLAEAISVLTKYKDKIEYQTALKSFSEQRLRKKEEEKEEQKRKLEGVIEKLQK